MLLTGTEGRLTPMPEAHSPTVRGRKLAKELRRARVAADLSADDAAAHLGAGWSQSRISRIEGARTKVSERDIAKMLDLYGIDSALREALLRLAKDAWKRGWWTDYSDVFRGSYVALEDDAARIFEWSPQLVPGLLQTEAYARAVTRASLRNDEAGVQRRVMARMTRATLLGRTDPAAPELSVVIDESALRRPIGGKEVMRGQLHAMLDAGRRSNVMIQVLPYEAGAHPGLSGAYILLGFPEDTEPDVGYAETKIGDGYAEDANAVRALKVDSVALQSAALSPEGSAEFIAAMTEE